MSSNVLHLHPREESAVAHRVRKQSQSDRPSQHVLRLPLSNEIGDFCLINAVSDGVEALDLTLTATEGECPYWTSIRAAELTKYLVKNSPITATEWNAILRSVFLREGNARYRQELVNLDAVATVGPSELVITFRKSVEGIHQRLGEIHLTQDEDREISLLSWVGVAVDRGNVLERNVVDLEEKCSKQGKIIRDLEEQLQEFTRKKEERENLLLERLCQHLNKSKLKTRDQLRLLAKSKVDQPEVEEGPAAHSSLRASASPSTKSRPNKRKVKSETVESGPDSDESAYEKMAVDDREPGTPERADSEDTDGNDDDLNVAPPSGTGQNRAVVPSKTKSPPPRRELPFSRIGGRSTGNDKAVSADVGNGTKEQAVQDGKSNNGNEDDGNDTSDDEL